MDLDHERYTIGAGSTVRRRVTHDHAVAKKQTVPTRKAVPRKTGKEGYGSVQRLA
jgi:hypothetical protein